MFFFWGGLCLFVFVFFIFEVKCEKEGREEVFKYESARAAAARGKVLL